MIGLQPQIPSVLRYCRGEQHLYHFNPILAPQENLFRGGGTHIAKDPVRLVVSGYRWLCVQPGTRQTHQAHHSGIFLSRSRSGGDAVFNSSTFRKEWIDRRVSLLNAWISPILILQGFHSRTQPREWYENPQQYIPKSRDVRVRYIDAGHFWRLRILMRLQRPSGTS